MTSARRRLAIAAVTTLGAATRPPARKHTALRVVSKAELVWRGVGPARCAPGASCGISISHRRSSCLRMGRRDALGAHTRRGAPFRRRLRFCTFCFEVVCAFSLLVVMQVGLDQLREERLRMTVCARAGSFRLHCETLAKDLTSRVRVAGACVKASLGQDHC